MDGFSWYFQTLYGYIQSTATSIVALCAYDSVLSYKRNSSVVWNEITYLQWLLYDR